MIAKEMIAEKVFAEGVAKDIRNFLPAKYENAEFQVMQMNKNNGVQMVGVQVRLQEENVCPVVYVEPFFNEIRLGEPVEKVMNEIARCMEEAGNAPFVHSSINPMDYDSVKEHLAVMLVNTQANKRMLQEMPHENMEDLSAICYVDFPVESNDASALTDFSLPTSKCITIVGKIEMPLRGITGISSDGLLSTCTRSSIILSKISSPFSSSISPIFSASEAVFSISFGSW